ncbi:flagellar type III secretion system pore protein FliP [Aquifex aeolicus]|uniref:Flagellar biosynthetic protein FliP n=1 Tax=Aquifex aeolicus (strain VF5) TaxID=224324 RepID=FLIP_AQUAE|nr:flagellar type III secretion system pore protein FliP [Aquifex aeolicus]O67750.1 RecName: Full=Flagellar biosynthetic protein FliP [Aquifex aeolicus VF5]AAC07711.1 flagellar biosynthetic protein FliP [Aquifex aeolicus VF5]
MRKALTILILSAGFVFSQIPPIELKVGEGNLVDSIRLLIFLTILSLVPSILIMFTSFTRLVVVLSLLRQAIGTPQAPPNQVIIALSLFLTFFIMKPTIDKINSEALQPYIREEISDEEFFKRVEFYAKDFMLKHTRKETLEAFLSIAKIPKDSVKEPHEIPLRVVIPAFMVSELKTAFEIVFLLYIPFLIVDLVVASILISMGIIMIPPQLISLPFKIMLFVLANGWELVVLSLVRSYQ